MTKKEFFKLMVHAIILSIIVYTVYAIIGYGFGVDFFKFYKHQTSVGTTSDYFDFTPIVISFIVAFFYNRKENNDIHSNGEKVSE
ncbi:hypothetical protein FP515_01000 [Geobacillus thermoleovorans]|uniref:Uncharacterized protein n=2 Tax=Geobacillus TaxID=129337 RepID=A0A1V9C4K5_9BACL|nr:MULTISPECIES: hypothetical protein [Geobacillus]OQP16506.1 hypothetical protein B1694_18785 [Geobacillus zalihae]QDY71910.1 hypothetical protein FP515_01000 [Geobacillus thermoleovorans]QNU18602.1 hypothetical protein IC807_02610 [Geobacillus zalihae]QNU24796.1 hypothetical protein IC806_17865 [Geobacillus zalihae]QNU24813.1 hypothetical protein IC806_00140 [Geobacillus zalihae]